MAGFSSVTGDEAIMFADNASFNGTQRGGKMTTDGQLWIGSTASPHVKLGTLTAGSGISITPGSGSITIAATSSAPGLVLLASANASSSTSIPFTSVMSTAFKNYRIVMSNFFMSNQNRIRMQVSIDNGANWIATGYNFSYGNAAFSLGTLSTIGTSADSFFLCNNVEAVNNQPPANITYDMFAGDGSNNVTYHGTGFINEPASIGQFYNFLCGYGSFGQVNAIQFIPESGNIQSGNFALYGYAF